MRRAYYDMARNYVLPPEGVTLASLGVPPYSPPAEDWEDEYPAFSGRADGFGPASGMEAPGAGISFADPARTISPAAEPGAWRDDNSAPFWIPDDARVSSGPSFDDFVRIIDPRANPNVWREDNGAPPYAASEDSNRYSVPYDPRATALGAFHIPGLPEDATGWGLRERLPDRVGDAELPVQLAAMLNRILGLELGTEFTERRGGPRGPSISGGGGGGGAGGGGGGGSNAPRGTPPSVNGPIYREGGPNPGNLKARPGEDLSFRDSLSNPYPTPPGRPPVFRAGKQYIEVDPSKLPPGSVHPDNVPPGHVTVWRSVPWETIMKAIIGKGKFPK
jgi:hypothetical protein